jgi:ATP-dependent RNA helicase RhlE
VSLVCVDEHKLLADIEKLLQKKIGRETIPGYAPDPRIKAEPITQGRGQRPPGKPKNGRKRRPQSNGRKRRDGGGHVAAR